MVGDYSGVLGVIFETFKGMKGVTISLFCVSDPVKGKEVEINDWKRQCVENPRKEWTTALADPFLCWLIPFFDEAAVRMV